jgi:hypothetical protein
MDTFHVSMSSRDGRRAPAAGVLIFFLVGLVGASTAHAQTEAPADQPVPDWLARVDVHGYVDTYYGYNVNRPADGTSFVPGTGTSAKRAGEFSLNLAALDIALAPGPVGMRVIVNYGTGAEVVHGGEPAGVAVGPDAWRFVQQASLIWQVAPELALEAGVYPSHIGFEVLPSKDNWTYTRSWMGELSPFYQTGVKASYAFTGELSAQLHVVNGWQIIGDNNRAKAVGTQVAWNTDALSLAFNTFAGPELPGDSDSWRLFGDIIAVVRPVTPLSLALVIDAGLQQLPGQDAATWQAAALFARYAVDETWAVAARGEIFSDRDAVVSGAGQRLLEGTLTVEARPAAGLVLKLEGRYDSSTENVFASSEVDATGNPERVGDQILVLLGAVAGF